MLSVVSIRCFNSWKLQSEGEYRTVQEGHVPGRSLPARSHRVAWKLSWAAGRRDPTSPPGRLASGTGSRTSEPRPGLWSLMTTRPPGAACAWGAGSRAHAGARPSDELTSVWRRELEIENVDLRCVESRPLSSSGRPSCPSLLLQSPPLDRRP